MSRKIQIALLGTDLVVVAELLDDVNREACDVLWRSLPYESVLMHTVVSGKNLHTFIPDVTPFFEHTPALARRMAAAPGTLFMPYPRCLFAKYGSDSEDHAFPPVARVAPEDLRALDEIGRAGWASIYEDKVIRRLRVTRLGDDQNARPFQQRLLDPASFEGEAVGRLVKEMNAEIEKIWLAPPAELLHLHSGRHSESTGMGSYGQYFSTLFYAEGEVNRLSNIPNMGVIDNLLRLCRQTEIDLATLKVATRTFCLGAAQYLKMCGQEPVSGFLLNAMELFPQLNSRAEYFRVFQTYALYTARLHGWHTHQFPWKHGERYRYAGQ